MFSARTAPRRSSAMDILAAWGLPHSDLLFLFCEAFSRLIQPSPSFEHIVLIYRLIFPWFHALFSSPCFQLFSGLTPSSLAINLDLACRIGFSTRLSTTLPRSFKKTSFALLWSFSRASTHVFAYRMAPAFTCNFPLYRCLGGPSP